MVSHFRAVGAVKGKNGALSDEMIFSYASNEGGTGNHSIKDSSVDHTYSVASLQHDDLISNISENLELIKSDEKLMQLDNIDAYCGPKYNFCFKNTQFDEGKNLIQALNLIPMTNPKAFAGFGTERYSFVKNHVFSYTSSNDYCSHTIKRFSKADFQAFKNEIINMTNMLEEHQLANKAVRYEGCMHDSNSLYLLMDKGIDYRSLESPLTQASIRNTKPALKKKIFENIASLVKSQHDIEYSNICFCPRSILMTSDFAASRLINFQAFTKTNDPKSMHLKTRGCDFLNFEVKKSSPVMSLDLINLVQVLLLLDTRVFNSVKIETKPIISFEQAFLNLMSLVYNPEGNSKKALIKLVENSCSKKKKVATVQEPGNCSFFSCFAPKQQPQAPKIDNCNPLQRLYKNVLREKITDIETFISELKSIEPEYFGGSEPLEQFLNGFDKHYDRNDSISTLERLKSTSFIGENKESFQKFFI